MVNRLYDYGRQQFLEGNVKWLTDTIRAVLIDANDYTPNFSTDQFLAIVPAAARVSISAALANKASTAGVADADDVTLTNVTGDLSEALIIYKDTGDVATSPLLAWIDSATGLPVQPNTGPIAITWDNGANRIFKL